ncbi:hypothetical protein EV192_106850 [Actinocrispum wychmicini]|uniref:Uncharacterized protein n=1 Tax=Actinocrispum wychmicini TaxID=1213861 RepID=A0A4R2JCR9_9PSEU|nr:hypothetical protein EV192_106850 [Actinocrispum wychmicini]
MGPGGFAPSIVDKSEYAGGIVTDSHFPVTVSDVGATTVHIRTLYP